MESERESAPGPVPGGWLADRWNWLALLPLLLTVPALAALLPAASVEPLRAWSALLVLPAGLAALLVLRHAAGSPAIMVTRRSGWRGLAAALVLLLGATLVPVLARWLPVAVIAGPLLQAGFCLVAGIALLVLLRPAVGVAGQSRVGLDAAVVLICYGVLLWYGVLRDQSWQGPAEIAVATASTGQCALLLVALIAVGRWPRDSENHHGTVAAALALALLVVALLLGRLDPAGPSSERLAPLLAVAGCAALAAAARLECLQIQPARPGRLALADSPVARLISFTGIGLTSAALLVLLATPPVRPAAVLAAALLAALPLLFRRETLAARLAAGRSLAQANEAAEVRLAELLRNSADGIAIVAADGRIRYAVPATERLFGQPAGSLVGRAVTEFVAVEDRERLYRFITTVLAAPRSFSPLEVRLPGGHGKPRSIEIHGANLADEPAIAGWLLNLREVTERRAAEEELRQAALHDSLTLLPNRTLFRDRAGHALAVGRRGEHGVAALFVDLDNFKKINDSLGHGQGDRVLRTSAQRLVQCTRSGDTVARLGGDEFAVLLENLADQQPAIEVAARIVAALSEPFSFLDSDLRVAASVGVAFARPGDGVEELMRNADVAMYAAKAQGKGRYIIFRDEMHQAAHRRLEIETELARALALQQFQLHYQPIVDLQSGCLLGVEALVRWRHPQRGLIAPADFLGIAEDSGQVIGLGRWVLRQACREVKAWQARVPQGRDLRLAVNVSPGQLEQSDLVADVGRALRDTGLAPECLVLEITEGVLMHHTDETLARLTRLKKLGVRIAIDDFGTGYSSLSYLHRFPIDILKIDRSFVERLSGSAEGAALARAIIALGETLGLEVVAEGIELEHQQRELVELGCVAGQGYYYSRPALLHELEYSVHMLRRRAVTDTLPPGGARFTATGRFLLNDLRQPDPDPLATGTFGK